MELPRAPQDQARNVASWAGYSLDDDQLEMLGEFAAWLEKEALPAGGIGPDEAPRIWDRHICDSLSFARGWPSGPPAKAIDVGSGVGLPGVPLAILWPSTDFVLLDRSGRRVELLRRLLRVQQIDNVELIQGDLAGVEGRYEGVFARGVMSPTLLAKASEHICTATGRIVIGLSRVGGPTGAELGLGRVEVVPSEVLDGGGQILIMEHCDE